MAAALARKAADYVRSKDFRDYLMRERWKKQWKKMGRLQIEANVVWTPPVKFHG